MNPNERAEAERILREHLQSDRETLLARLVAAEIGGQRYLRSLYALTAAIREPQLIAVIAAGGPDAVAALEALANITEGAALGAEVEP